MSAGISALSDAELLSQLQAAGSGGTPGGGVQVRLGSANDAPPSGGVSALSDAELMRQLGQHDETAKPATFDERFGTGPMARDGGSGPLYEGLKDRAAERLVGKPSTENAIDAAIFSGANAFGLNAPRNMVAGAEALRSGKSFDESYQYVKDTEEALARQHPRASLGGTIAGIGGAMVGLPALGGAATLGGRMVQAGTTGALYGSAAEALDSKDLGKAAVAGAIGAGLGAAAQPVAEMAIKGAQAIIPMLKRGLAIRNDDGSLSRDAMNAMLRAGVDPAKAAPELEAAITQTFAKKGISEAAVREGQASEFAIPLSRGQASQDARLLEAEHALVGGDRGAGPAKTAGRFFDQQAEAINAARGDIGTRLAGGESRVSSPFEAGEMVAGRAREFAGVADDAERVALREAEEALARVRGGQSPDAIEAGATVATGVRDRAAQAKKVYQDAYADVAKIPGEFEPGALDRLGSRVRERLGADVPIDERLTPAATRALADLDALPGLFRTEEGLGPNLQQVDQVRKRLVALRGSTAQNPTDRRALDRILGEFDNHVEDAMGAGLFGSRQASRAAPADDFPGMATQGEGISLPLGKGGDFPHPSGREREPETLIRFLGREGGIPLDGDARAADLGRIQTGYGPLGRQNGRSLDDLRPRLIEEGFLPPDRDGGMARNIGDEVHELIRRERAGDPTYRIQDRDRAAGIDRGGRAAGADEHFADLVQREAQRITADHEAVGLRARDLDPDALREASESLVRGHHSDPFEAYEAAVMGRAAGGKSATVADIPFDGATARAASDALPGGTTAPSEAMKRARGAFSDYQKTFKPQGAGDDVGQAMRRIVERDAQPVEVASMLFGGSKVGNTGLSVRLAGRLKSTLGEESAEWGAVQQGLISKALGTDASPQAMAERVRYLLQGEGRGLAKAVLSPEQIAGLERFRTGVQLAGKARDAAPSWVRDVAQGQFDPARVVDDLFGRVTTGSRPGSIQFAQGLKGTLGAESHEWQALRQALWQKISTKGEGGDGFGPKELTQRVMSLVEGPGKKLGEAFFSAEELAMMKRFAGQVTFAVPPKVSRNQTPDQTLMQALRAKAPAAALNGILAAIGLAGAGPFGAASLVGANMARKSIGAALASREARAIGKGAPKAPDPPPNLRHLGTAAGLSAEQAY